MPGASLWQTEQMPYTNKQPDGVSGGLPSILRCYIDSKCWDLQLLQQRLCALTTHYHSQNAKQPRRVTYFYLAVISCCFCHLQLWSFIWLYFWSWAKGYCEYAACIYQHKRDHCQKLMQTLKLSCLCTVGCGGCNLNWLHKTVERLWFKCFELESSVFYVFFLTCCSDQNFQRFWLC